MVIKMFVMLVYDIAIGIATGLLSFDETYFSSLSLTIESRVLSCTTAFFQDLSIFLNDFVQVSCAIVL